MNRHDTSMESDIVSESPHISLPDKSVSSDTSDIFANDNDGFIQATDMSITDSSYIKTTSSSSSASISTIDRPSKRRNLAFKNGHRSRVVSKQHFRHDRLFRRTYSLSRKYVMAMTNILFQMEKDIYKLKRRTQCIEQMLVDHSQAKRPIVRIPRLTPDEISTICVKKPNKRESTASEDWENSNNLQTVAITDINSPNEHNDGASCSITSGTPRDSTDGINNKEKSFNQKPKFCTACRHEFSHRSGYLRHIKNIHNGIVPSISGDVVLTKNDNTPDHSTTTEQAQVHDLEIDSELSHFLVNQWDIGEGRLRPRLSIKQNIEVKHKAKCEICNKFFHAGYIKKHKMRAHPSPSSSPIPKDIPDLIQSAVDKPADVTPSISNEFAPVNTVDSPLMVNIAAMDVDERHIDFSVHSSKQFFIATTCLQRYQLDLVDEFLRKFSSEVVLKPIVDFETTHLIVDDEQQPFRSSLSIKLVEAVANHCYCVSYQWIIECLKYDRLIDETRFEIDGDTTHSQISGGPRRSRLTEKRHSLFENICFIIKCTENNDIKLTNERLQGLITTCGGKIITCVTQSALDQYTVVVLCDKFYVSERRHNYDQCRSLGINFVSSHWVLVSILDYQQKNLQQFAETPL
ncbi:unnamed protein product [Adineta ricciae]|uniref:Uncharacterized protein n=1 Tax=Adineta ricciae TaxID=249248 RepID=A0A815EK68_ADIRI|nr:unnamed protein product [Adineta ricciae]